MDQDQRRSVCHHQDRQICRQSNQAVCEPGISGQKRKDAKVEKKRHERNSPQDGVHQACIKKSTRSAKIKLLSTAEKSKKD